MGLGALLRNIVYEVTDTEVPGESQVFTVLTDGPGLLADWNRGEYGGVLGIPGAWRASMLLSGLLGAMPWRAYRETPADGPLELIAPTPDLLRQPNWPETRMTTLSGALLDLIFHGNAIGPIATRGPDGEATSWLPQPASSVQVRRAIEYDPSGLQRGDKVYLIGNREYGSRDVIHVMGPAQPGSLRGMGLLEAHLNTTFKLASELGRQANSVATAAVPTGILKSLVPDLDQPEADAMKAAWRRSQRDRTVAVLNATTDYVPVAWNPTETQLVEARRLSLLELAHLFGVDASWLGANISSAPYSNVELQGINLTRYSALGMHIAQFEQTLEQALAPGTRVKVNLDALLRADTLTRYQAHEIGIRAGFITADEVRGIEDRPPLTDAQRKQAAADKAPPAPPPGADQGPPKDKAKTDGPPAARSEADLWIYWTAGAGRAKWALSAEPLRALYDQLASKIPDPALARRTALAWFADGMGRPVGPEDGSIPGGTES
jgi:HK97 family phage portal protein